MNSSFWDTNGTQVLKEPDSNTKAWVVFCFSCLDYWQSHYSTARIGVANTALPEQAKTDLHRCMSRYFSSHVGNTELKGLTRQGVSWACFWSRRLCGTSRGAEIQPSQCTVKVLSFSNNHWLRKTPTLLKLLLQIQHPAYSTYEGMLTFLWRSWRNVGEYVPVLKTTQPTVTGFVTTAVIHQL